MSKSEFIGEIELLESNTWGHIVRVPDEIAEWQLKENKSKRIVSRYNDDVEVQQALLSSGDGFYFLLVNKKVLKKLGVLVGQTVTVEIRKDNSKYGLPMPEEFREVLNQDEQADKIFHSLTAGKMRSLLHIAGNVKNSEKRIQRSLAIAHHLKRNKGEIDYKGLQEDLKFFRRNS